MERSNDSTEQKSSASGAKKAIFFALVYCVLLLSFETGARLVYFVKESFNPYYLTFGFVPNIEWHSDEYDGYTKFQPDSTYRQKLHGETIHMKINAQGFRGERDFAMPKPSGTTRVVALGASSTFGFYDRDEETYPYFLEQRMRSADPDALIEILNLGIPHFRMDNILALARAELAALEPDVVLLYAGYNNAMIHESPEEGNLLFRIKTWLNFHSVAWRGIKPMILAIYYRSVRWLNRDIAQLPNLHVPIQLSEQKVSELRARLRRNFRAEVEELADIVAATGATFVPVTQTYTLRKLGNKMGLEGRWDTYADETRHVATVLETNGEIPAPQSTLLIHLDFMEEIRDLAAERNLPLVEGIAAVDGHRDEVMASYVHLTGPGNELLAAAIHETLLESASLEGARAETR